MAVKEILQEIESEVIDVAKTNFNYIQTAKVPSSGDTAMTYENGIEKRGKILKTCVLYVDIRNSVALTEKHHSQTMGRIYTAFTKAVLKIARHHKGHTRNIIGDRVMVVFPTEDCFTNAVECAISINHIAKFIIKPQFSGVDFKCGIGIDFGELKTIKVGIQRRRTEHAENKGLVWTGYPANIASRLTDFANKKLEETQYEVTRNPTNPKKRLNYPLLNSALLMQRSLIPKPLVQDNEPYYLPTIEKVIMSKDEFDRNLFCLKDGTISLFGGKFISFERKIKTIDYPAILMTQDVYSGYKAANPVKKDITEQYWREQPHQIKNVKCKIFGGDINWAIK